MSDDEPPVDDDPADDVWAELGDDDPDEEFVDVERVDDPARDTDGPTHDTDDHSHDTVDHSGDTNDTRDGTYARETDDDEYATDTDGHEYAGGTDDRIGGADEEFVDAESVDDQPPEADEAFEEMDVGSLDGEALWEELAAGESSAAVSDSGAVDSRESVDPRDSVDETLQEAADAGGQTADRVERDAASGEESIIDKRQYCQQCPYFTAPPEVRCTHDGTAIIEVLEDGRFRVSDCPVVTETGPDRTILEGGD
ncbi:MAG: hypothetical protein ACOC0Z_05195 [Halohasta sp.]